MVTTELLLGTFDDYIRTLRLLTRKYLGSDRLEDLPWQLEPDWRFVEDWFTGLCLFELLGIRASGYPAVFNNGGEAEYATPLSFVQSMTSLTVERTAVKWLMAPPAAVELDPRYVAFRTIHDWIILNAKILAEKNPDQARVKPDDVDPFEQNLPAEVGDELSCGNPRDSLLRGGSVEWNLNHFEPEWQCVTDPFWTARFFFHDGMLLTDRLRYGALRDGNDPRGHAAGTTPAEDLRGVRCREGRP